MVPETGYFVSGNRRLCFRFRQQNRMFPDTKYPVSGTSVEGLYERSAFTCLAIIIIIIIIVVAYSLKKS